MGRAGGRQARQAGGKIVESGEHLPFEDGFRGSPVEDDARNAAVRVKEMLEVVDGPGFRLNHCVQAAFPRAGMEHVPERDAGGFQRVRPDRIGSAGIDAQQFRKNGPERVARVSVVLVGIQGRPAGHAAENQHRCGRIRNGREALYAGHGTHRLRR